jgi:membrane-associated protein
MQYLYDLFIWLGSEQGLMAALAEDWLYGTFIVASIIFVETGVVLMPFLPGDSLLFGAGAFLGIINVNLIIPLFVIMGAAIVGDAVNYSIGRSALGQQIVRRGWVKPHHMAKTHDYFERYGAWTITVARFIPIVRTVAPFVAGLSHMSSRKFALYNVIGAIVWCTSLILAGYWLGTIPWVRSNLHWLSLGIVMISALPVAVHIIKIRRTPPST